MPELARGLGWGGLSPIRNEDFDQLFVLRLDRPGAVPEVRSFLQSDLLRRDCGRKVRFPLVESWTSPSIPSPTPMPSSTPIPLSTSRSTSTAAPVPAR